MPIRKRRLLWTGKLLKRFPFWIVTGWCAQCLAKDDRVDCHPSHFFGWTSLCRANMAVVLVFLFQLPRCPLSQPIIRLHSPLLAYHQIFGQLFKYGLHGVSDSSFSLSFPGWIIPMSVENLYIWCATGSSAWHMYSSRTMLPFIGALFWQLDKYCWMDECIVSSNNPLMNLTSLSLSATAFCWANWTSRKSDIHPNSCSRALSPGAGEHHRMY